MSGEIDSLKNWLDSRLGDMEERSKERMTAHMQHEEVALSRLNEILMEHHALLHGNPKDDATPGIIKKIDRIESGMSFVKWAGGAGLFAGATGWLDKILSSLGKK